MLDVKSILASIVLSAIVILPIVLIITDSAVPKVGIVRAQDLVAKNAMFKEIMDSWQNQESALKTNIVTLESEIQSTTETFERVKNTLSESERANRIQMLDSKRQEYFSYVNSMQAQAEERHAEVMKSVLSRINQVMEKYGEENGFDFILGSAGEGNILYGAVAIDITDEVLEVFNSEYYDEKN